MAYAVTAAATAQRHNTALAAIVVAGTADVRTGIALAKAVSAQRPSLPVLTVVPNHKEGRLLQMWKNLHPVLLKDESDSKKVLNTAAIPIFLYNINNHIFHLNIVLY